jgi:hypothetical protein
VTFNDKIPSKELGPDGNFIGLHLTPISNNVKTSHSFFKLYTGLFDGVGLAVTVVVGVIVGVGVTLGVAVFVGVTVGVGVVVGVKQTVVAGTFNILIPL